MRVLVVVGVLLAIWSAAEAGEEEEGQRRLYPARCYPGTSCWPSHGDIAHLDKLTVGVVLQPSSQDYRANVLYVNERLTKHPGLVLVAQTVDDVQKGVMFARKFNLLLSVRGANAQTYDYTGRLTNDGGFVIDMSNMRSAVASVLNVNVNNDPGSVTVDSGATWQDVFSAVENSGRVVVGTNPSDSVLDTTLTPGISPLSRTLGLVSDNLLSARVVLSDGRLATVSSAGTVIDGSDGDSGTYDPKLFYALRGGGYNWAVPVSFTFRLHFPPFQEAYVDGLYKLYVDGDFLGRDALKFVLSQVVNLPSEWGGYVMVDGAPSSLDPNDKGSVAVNLFHYGAWAGTAVSSVSDLLNYTPQLIRDRFDVNILDNYQQYRDASGEKDVFDSWPNTYIGNSLIGNDVFTNNTKFDELVDLMTSVVNTPAVDSNIRCIARLLGGQISSRASQTDSISQELRDARMSVTCGLMWRDSMRKEDFYLAHARKGEKALRYFGKGVDPRFASEDLEDWKTAIYSSKYSTLLETKRHVDIDNFLWTYNHVASDFSLNCRYGKCH